MTPQRPVPLPALPATGNLWRTGQLNEKGLTEDGWTFVRVTWANLFREQEFKARILAALRR